MDPRSPSRTAPLLAVALAASALICASVSLVAHAQSDDGGTAGAADEAGADEGDGGDDTDDEGACGELTREDCRRAGRSFLIAAGAYDGGCLLLALLLYWVLSKRGSFSQIVNLLIPLFLFPIGATILVALDPVRDANFFPCVACQDYAKVILLAAIGKWPRGLVLGGAPTFGVFFVVVLIWNRIGK